MRIALFTESYFPVTNGVATAVQRLAETLRPEHEVTIFAPHFNGHQWREPGLVRFPSYHPPGHPDYPLAIPFSIPVYRDFKALAFDVVHTHSPFALGVVGRRWARRHRLPLVTTYHTLYVEYAHYGRVLPRSWVRAGLQSVSRRYCNQCDAVAVPTDPVREVLLDYGVHRPIAVIPTGVPDAALPPRDPAFPRDALLIPHDRQIVLYAGRLAPEKNLGLLFQAFATVAAQNPPAHLLVAGGGPAEADAHRTVEKLRLQDRVTFAGFIPHDQLLRCYVDADVLAFSSLTDTQGLVLVEAKAAGLPAVCVDAYGPATVVRDGLDGFRVPNDPAAFANAISRVLQDEALRRTLSAAARADATRFTIRATADRYLELYEQARQQTDPKAAAAPAKSPV